MSWEDFSTDFDLFVEELSKVPDTERTSHSLYSISMSMKQSWLRLMRVKAADIPIPLPRNKNLHPRQCSLDDAFLSFEFELGKDFESDCVPYISNFQVKVKGTLELDNSFVSLEDHWRVDSHAFPAMPEPKEPHPYIHFQRGGHAQDEFSSQPNFVPGHCLPAVDGEFWQGLMQYSGPRMPTPPYCPILAIDMVIGQHNGDVWRSLRARHSYRKVVADAQRRLWDPFFAGLSNSTVRNRWLGKVLV